MAVIKPFSALRYDPAKAGAQLEQLICPPYDVIDPAMQEELHRRSPHNIVHVELARERPGDAPGNDRYSRAARTLGDWIARGVLKEDSQPAFYVYEQRFDIAAGGASRSKVVTRRGFFGAIKLEPFGTGCVYPHEETFGGPKADRLNLMRACATNVSAVFGLVPDEDKAIAAMLQAAAGSGPPCAQATEDNGVVNRLWAVSDPDWCKKLSGQLGGKNIFIADGHHRYETSCKYRDERRQADGDPAGKLDKAYDHGLMVCVPMSDEGLYILPTHRLIQAGPGISKDSFLRAAGALFKQQDATEKELCALAEEQAGGALAEDVEDDLHRFHARVFDGLERLLHLLHAHPVVLEFPRAHHAVQSLEYLGGVEHAGGGAVELEEIE